MNKTDLADNLIQKLPKDVASNASAKRIVNAIFDMIEDELCDKNSVSISNFGTFSVVDKAQRVGHNLRTKEQIIIPATKAVRFSASKNLKDKVKA